MKEKTAVMLIIEQSGWNKNTIYCQKMLQLEKKQIIDAANNCSAKTALDMFNNSFKSEDELMRELSNENEISRGETYFTDTYEQSKDEPNIIKKGCTHDNSSNNGFCDQCGQYINIH